jgi:DNA gyrase subunit A
LSDLTKPPQGDQPDGIEPVSIIEEMQRSYLDYAMSVIVSRALPDVRDGMKPVHRRIIYASHESGYHWNRKHVKSARPVSDVMGKYHPHGDASIYDALVRMAQDWSLRVPLIDGQGNFGSIDGDPPAAMRYTEARLTKVAHELIEDIDKDTVDFQDNYDGSDSEPKVLPARFPEPFRQRRGRHRRRHGDEHPAAQSRRDLSTAAIALIDNPAMELPDLMEIIPGPDFPTGGIILGRSGIYNAYSTGRGSVVRCAAGCRSSSDANDREAIVIDRGSLPGEQGLDDREDGRTGAREAHRGHLRYPRRERPAGLPRRHRAQARRQRRRGAQPALPLHAACRPRSASTCGRTQRRQTGGDDAHRHAEGVQSASARR